MTTERNSASPLAAASWFILTAALAALAPGTTSGAASLPAEALVKKMGASNLVRAASQTQAASVQAARQTGPNIAPELWAEDIRRLRPIRVYLHRVNVVVVLKAEARNEEGLYISIPISSYVPASGRDGFTFRRLAPDVFRFSRTLADRAPDRVRPSTNSRSFRP